MLTSGAFLVLCCILAVLMHDKYVFNKPAQYHFFFYTDQQNPNICDYLGNVLFQPVVHRFAFTAQEGEWTGNLHGSNPTLGLWKIQSEGSIISLCALSHVHINYLPRDFSKAVCEPIQLNTYFNNNGTNNLKTANSYHANACVLLRIIPA